MTVPADIPLVVSRTGATASRYSGAGLLVTGLAADTLRHDFDPVSKAARGILIEAAFTNLLTRSEELGHADWTRTNGTVTDNDQAAPDGTAGMDLFAVTSTGSGGAYAQQNKAATVSQRFAASAHFRKRDTDWAAIEILDGSNNGRRFWFNLATGALGSAAAVGSGLAAAGYRIENCGGGVWRCLVAVTMGADTTAKCIFHPACDADASIAVTAGRGNHAWGFMAGVGADCGSYVKTTSAAQARGADVISIPTAKLLRPAGFTLCSEFVLMQAWQLTQRRGVPCCMTGPAATRSIPDGRRARRTSPTGS